MVECIHQAGTFVLYRRDWITLCLTERIHFLMRGVGGRNYWEVRPYPDVSWSKSVDSMYEYLLKGAILFKASIYDTLNLTLT